jgi:short-subunit dehydrogenase
MEDRRSGDMTGSTPGWEGRVALITGASSGIGAAVARRLALEGLRVVLVARREDRLNALASEIRASGGEAMPLTADLTEESGRVRVVEASRLAFGSPDVLINNAGFGWYGYGADMPWSVARQMIQVNAEAAVQLSLMLLPEMRRRDHGHVINVSSIAGSLPNQGVALYSATKSFLDSFTTALYRELRGTNVHLSLLKPGPVTTEFFDVAARKSSGRRVPAERLGVRVSAIVDCIWSLLNRPRRVAYVPSLLSLVPWVEPSLGWLIDRLGPLLLRRRLGTPS